MSDRTFPFDPEAVCDCCGAKGATDFMGDYYCPKCVHYDEDGNIEICKEGEHE